MTKERLAVILFSSKRDDSVIYLTDIWLLFSAQRLIHSRVSSDFVS